MFFHFGADKAQAARSETIHSDNVPCVSDMAISFRIFASKYGVAKFYYNGEGQIITLMLI
ncbi:hypothetical protein TSA6c_19560 [Azospirillum sp. TSA6c]|nr:hypothetical protein TSA6c_19560 [Azospirillum sp. TSA6c]